MVVYLFLFFRDKYSNPGGYTIFHFKVPKKNCNSTTGGGGGVTNPPALTALKKTYNSSGDKKIPQRTEKVTARKYWSLIGPWPITSHLSCGVNN